MNRCGIYHKRSMVTATGIAVSFLAVCLFLTGALFFGRLMMLYTGNHFSFGGNCISAQPLPAESRKSLIEYEQAIIDATQNAIPAVVTIHTYGTKIVEIRDPLLRYLYGRRIGRRRVSGMGSGVIIDSDGIVITNDHVIGLVLDSSDNIIKVSLTDGRTFDAELIKSYPAQDIAILSIKGDNLPFIEFASSADLIQGQTTIAIGNPFGNILEKGLSSGEPTVTRGIVSALKRSLTIQTDGIERFYRNMIQTDASINEGNSGGALINIEGKLIGINTAIFTTGGSGSIGIGFAIPSERVKLIYDRVRQYGDIGETYVGIFVEDMTSAMREALGLNTGSGIIITTIEPDSPGEESGFKRGDVITGINGLIVSSTKDAGKMFTGAIPSEVFTLTVYRNNEFREMELKLGAK